MKVIKSTMNKLVSVIMPNYNSGKYISQAIESVLNQTYENVELIIVDDCSTDNSIEIIKSFQNKDNRIKLFKNEKNSGAAVSRNRAIKEANGVWIAFLDSDDIWMPDKLEKQIGFMTDNGYHFSFTHFYFDKNGELSEFSVKDDSYDYYSIIKHNHIACPTVIYNSDILGKNYMPEDAIKREDFGCWLKMLKKYGKIYCLHESLLVVKIHEGSVSKSKIKMVKYQWNVYRRVEKIPFFKSCFYMLCWAFYGLKKYY